jgi:CHAT domain
MPERESPPNNVLMMEEPAVGLVSNQLEQSSPEKRTLHVSWNKRQAELSYTIYSTDSTEDNREWVQSSPENSEAINLFWNNLNNALNPAISVGSPSEDMWESIQLYLQGIGQGLFRSIVPQAVASHLQNWEPGFSLRISTNEQWIPWELMYDGNSFLGDKFILTRYPRLQDRRNSPVTNRTTAQRLNRVKKIVNVVGGNINQIESKRASELFGKPSDIVNLLERPSINKLISSLQEADILHFTCHGHLKPLNLLQNYSDSVPYNNLCIDTVQQLPLRPGIFVFANACTSTTPTQAFSDFTSFGWEFYRQGADIFIGTLGTIPTKYAINFAENVYEGLLHQDCRLTVGEAVAKAKRLAASSSNIFWLLYCIYGNPDFYFETVETTYK